jgi:hypothetical protein
MDNEELFFDEKKYIKECVEAWTAKGLLEAYKDKATREIMAQLFANQDRLQRRHDKLRESDQTTSTLGLSVFPTQIVYPLIDQIFPRLIAMQLCQVKPMRASTGRFVTRAYQKSADSSAFTHTGSGALTDEVGTVPLGKMTLTSVDITAQKYSLRARYSLETIEDAVADGIDFETEMISALRDEIMGEIDYVVLNEMFTGATADAVSFATSSVHSYESVKEHQAELWDAIVDANNNVFKEVQQDCNFIVGNAAAIGNLEKLVDYGFTRTAPPDLFQAGSLQVGNLNSQYKVFKSTMAPANKLLVGVAKVPYLFCPYVPLELTPVDYKDETEELGRGVRTRFGRKLIDGNYYSVISLS